MGRERNPLLYRTCPPVVDTRFDEDQTITEALITAVAHAANVAPDELPPLYDTIDPETLSQLFEQHSGGLSANTILSFTYDTWNIFVHADGRIRVCDGTQEIEPEPVFETAT